MSSEQALLRRRPEPMVAREHLSRLRRVWRRPGKPRWFRAEAKEAHEIYLGHDMSGMPRKCGSGEPSGGASELAQSNLEKRNADARFGHAIGEPEEAYGVSSTAGPDGCLVLLARECLVLLARKV